MGGERELETGVSARLTAAEGRKFGLLVGGAFLALGALLWWRTHLTAASVALVLGSALIAGGLVAPTRLGPIYRGWMALALAISKVTTPVFMGVIFFLVLVPTGLLARLLGHRPLSRPRDAATYWQTRPAGGRRGDMDNQF
jgi:saxitoxin biosynthesis operon SxtJ-like protein